MRSKLKILIIACFLLFALLLLRDPFSKRTLIPNFEPFPDTFFYVVPPLNLIKGEGFYLSREGRISKHTNPPLYSLTFIPFFAIYPDPRMFYFANILLSMISLLLFLSILKKVTNNIWIISFTLILYITNYYIYWMPTLAMAENLVIPLYLTSIIFLFRKNSYLTFILLGVVSLCIYATKGANFPVSVSILLLSLIKIMKSGNEKVFKIKYFLSLSSGFGLLFILYSLFEYFVQGYNVMGSLLLYFGSANQALDQIGKDQPPSTNWFSFSYMKANLSLYLSSFLGNPQKFLWNHIPLIPNYVAFLSISGIILGVFTKENRFLSIVLITMLISSIAFLLPFYSFDARYIYIAIPSFLIGFSMFMTHLFNLHGEKIQKIIKIGILALFLFYIGGNAFRIKSQISLNLRYAETPWWYISVLKLNEYFTEDKIIKNNKKPVVISAVPPYLVDFYSNGNYTLLPLSSEQEFMRGKYVVWGPNDYSDLPKLYTKYINEGFDLYVSKYGLGDEGYTNRDFNTIVEKFDIRLVLQGCFEQCNIYSVKLKGENVP